MVLGDARTRGFIPYDNNLHLFEDLCPRNSAHSAPYDAEWAPDF